MLPARPVGVGRPISDRAAWEGLAAREAWQDVVERAERLAATALPDSPDDLYLDYSRTGNRSRWERVSGRRRGRIPSFTLAECIENEGRFLRPLEATIRAVCAERTWVAPAHDRSLDDFYGRAITIDLISSALAWDLATADHLLGDRLSGDVRRLIRREAERRVLGPYRDMVLGNRRAMWWMRTTNNWNAVCLSGVTGAALALVEPPEERAFFVVAAEEYSRNFLRGFTADGYCSEGVGYWNYGFGRYVLLAEAIRRSTGGGVDLLSRPETRAPALYGVGIQIAEGVSPAFADCSVGSQPNWRVLHFVSCALGLGLAEYEERDPVRPGGFLPETMLYAFPGPAFAAPAAAAGATGEDMRSWFDQAGVLIGRPGANASCRLAVALKGGHNAEHHNHNDVGSYVVVCDGHAVLLDPGGEVYTARTFSSDRYESNALNSWGHPVPVVAGRLQKTGREARGEVITADFSDGRDTLVLDMTSAYDVPELVSLQRTFEYSRAGAGGLTVTDDVAFSSPQSFETALVTLGRAKELAPGVLLVDDIKSAVRVAADTGGVRARFTQEVIDEDMHLPSKPLRIGVELAQPVARATVRLTITPAERPEAGLVNGGFEEGRWGWRIPDDGHSSLAEGTASSGTSSLKITDASRTTGSNVTATAFPAQGGMTYELIGDALVVSGDGLGLYVRFLDAEGRILNETQDERGWISPVLVLGREGEGWRPFSSRFTTPAATAQLQLWIHSMNASQVEAYLDELRIVPVADGR
jgi:hypothetical protein